MKMVRKIKPRELYDRERGIYVVTEGVATTGEVSPKGTVSHIEYRSDSARRDAVARPRTIRVTVTPEGEFSMADAHVFGNPRTRDAQIDAIESLWLETKARYYAKQDKTPTDAAAFRAAKIEFLEARRKWRVEADKERA